MKSFLTFIALIVLMACSPQSGTKPTVPSGPWDEWAERNPGWVEPIAPYHIMDNLYYVGSKGLGAYLITGEDGHIILDGGLPQNGPMIVQSVEVLGFDSRDVKILLNSHAHFDHSGGLAYLKAITGAELWASHQDTPWLENGYYPGAPDKPEYSSPPVKVDKSFDNEEVIILGDIEMTPLLTPGHSPGCTSFKLKTRFNDRTYDTLIFGSATVAGNNLVPEQYPGIIDDFEYTFSKTKNWSPDIVVSNHPDYFFDQEHKMGRKIAGDQLAFVDRDIFQKQAKALERSFRQRLAKEMGAEKQ